MEPLFMKITFFFDRFHLAPSIPCFFTANCVNLFFGNNKDAEKMGLHNKMKKQPSNQSKSNNCFNRF